MEFWNVFVHKWNNSYSGEWETLFSINCNSEELAILLKEKLENLFPDFQVEAHKRKLYKKEELTDDVLTELLSESIDFFIAEYGS